MRNCGKLKTIVACRLYGERDRIFAAIKIKKRPKHIIHFFFCDLLTFYSRAASRLRAYSFKWIVNFLKDEIWFERQQNINTVKMKHSSQYIILSYECVKAFVR